MNRPRKPVLQKIKNRLEFNIKTGRYEIEENGIVYSMSYETAMHLKLNIANVPTVRDWYNDLGKFTKSQIIRTGDLPKQKEDFFPDFTPED